MRYRLVASLVFVLITLGTSSLIARDVQADGGHSHGGLFGGLLSPFRSTFDRTRRFLGGGASVVGDEHNSSLSEETYEMFRRLYNMTSLEEISRRLALFQKRRQEIQQSLLNYAQGRQTYTMRENPFIYWLDNELKALAGASPPKKLAEFMPEERQALAGGPEHRRRRRRSIEDDTFNYTLFDREDNDEYHHAYESENEDPGLNVLAPQDIPDSKDWRASNCISTPLNQMKCGCCYAIATMSVVEAMRCLNQGNSAPLLSPQHIVDCATPRAGYQNFGCNGGWPTRVLKYLQDTGVAVRESCYPFVRKQEYCKLRQVKAMPGCSVMASPTNQAKLTYRVLNNERDILRHVALTGPVVTVMKTTHNFLYYSDGVFDDQSCTRRRDDVDHAVVIVGYGRERNLDYWLIKNSWGTTNWGQMGYGKVRRGRNACSIGHWGWVVTS